MLNIDDRLIKEVSAKIRPNALSVLLAIAIHLNKKDGRCFPSHSTLMRLTGLGRDAVYSALEVLKDAGLLKSIQFIDIKTKHFGRRNFKLTTRFIKIFVDAEDADPLPENPYTDEPETDSPYTDEPETYQLNEEKELINQFELINKKEHADAEAPLAHPFKKTGEIEIPENNLSLNAKKEKNLQSGAGGGGAPGGQNGAAVRISLLDPDLPGVQIVDEVKPEPQTQPEKTGRGKAKNGRSIEPTIHPENETVFSHFNNPEKARAAWLTWIRYKAAEHRERYKSAETELIKIRSLFRDAAADSETAAQMIEQSIGNLWRGIFKIKDQKNGQQIGNLNAAQRQHLNLANYIAQRRIAAMERAANGGSVD